MIAIVRIEGDAFTKSCVYEVRINKAVICTFEHKYTDGLAKCLMRASHAVAKKKWMDAAKVLGGMKINDNN